MNDLSQIKNNDYYKLFKKVILPSLGTLLVTAILDSKKGNALWNTGKNISFSSLVISIFTYHNISIARKKNKESFDHYEIPSSPLIKQTLSPTQTSSLAESYNRQLFERILNN